MNANDEASVFARLQKLEEDNAAMAKRLQSIEGVVIAQLYQGMGDENDIKETTIGHAARKLQAKS